MFCVYASVSFFASFSLIYLFTTVFNCIPKTGWDAKKYKEKEM